MGNLRQIARLAGVSLTTVSLALRDHPNISAQTRKKVKEIARKLNYGLAAKASHQFADGRVIGYVIHDGFGVLATDMLRGAMEEARKSKFGILMVQVAQSQEWIEEEITNLLDMGISGLVIAHSYRELLPRRILLNLRSRGIHVVQVMNTVFADPLDSVCRSESEYARIAAEHLSALGHRRVFGLHLSPKDLWESIFDAREMELTVNALARGAERVQQAFESFKEMTPRPTAIIASMDDDAYRLLNLANHAGLAVPENLSILGMGNILGSYLYPEITTIDIQAQEMGRVGVRLLTDRMTAGIPPHELTDFKDIVLPAHVIERGSTAPMQV